MATAEEIKARAREIMAQDLPEYYNPEVKDDEVLIAEGGIDSLGFIQVLTKLEAEFDAHEVPRCPRRSDLAQPALGNPNIAPSRSFALRLVSRSVWGGAWCATIMRKQASEFAMEMDGERA